MGSILERGIWTAYEDSILTRKTANNNGYYVWLLMYSACRDVIIKKHFKE